MQAFAFGTSNYDGCQGKILLPIGLAGVSVKSYCPEPGFLRLFKRICKIPNHRDLNVLKRTRGYARYCVG
jgi:hypothetical protein